MIPALVAPTTDRDARPTTPVRRWWTSGWIPSLTAAASVGWLMVHHGVSTVDLISYTVYIGLAVTLPGTLVWRALNGKPRILIEDIAAGTAMGFALAVLAYLPARAVGAPRLALAWSVGTMVAFAAIPRLRRYWRSAPDAPRPGAAWSWTMAALFGVLMLYLSATYLRGSSLTWPGYASGDSDMYMHLALIGEVKRHVPPLVPYIPARPLYYHWFAYAEMASTSWATGVEPLVLLRRLSLLPYLAVSVVLVGAIARRLTGQWWSGPAAVAVTFLVLAPHPYGWRMMSWLGQYGFGVVEDGSLLRLSTWLSPTQTFGGALFAAAVLLLVDLLDDTERDTGRGLMWVAFGTLLVAIMGAKATYLPMLLAALVLVVGVGLLRRRPSRAGLIAAGLTAVCVAFAQLVLFGGVAQGLYLSPLTTMKVIGLGAETGLFAGPARPLVMTVVVGIFVICWLMIWGGMVGLRRGRAFLNPTLLLLLGIGAAGIGASSLLAQTGLSQSFFFSSARPYLSIAAVCGLAALGAGRRPVAMAVAVAAGGLTIFALRAVGATTLPPGTRQLLLALAVPYAVLAALVVAALCLRRRLPVALVLAALLGCGAESAVHDRLAPPIWTALHTSWRDTSGWPILVSRGTLEAGRWLRDHSRPEDVVATNAHCLLPTTAGPCLNLHVSISAFTERRVLIESWGYTDRALQATREFGTQGVNTPFWDPELLAANDAAFSAPSAAVIGTLHDRYGVRWLFVDRAVRPASADLGQYATLRFTDADCAVYEVGTGGH